MLSDSHVCKGLCRIILLAVACCQFASMSNTANCSMNWSVSRFVVHICLSESKWKPSIGLYSHKTLEPGKVELNVMCSLIETTFNLWQTK